MAIGADDEVERGGVDRGAAPVVRRVAVEVESEAVAARAVRRVLRAIVVVLETEVDAQDLELLVSETVTNAVALRAGAVEVEVETRTDGLRVHVHDHGAGTPVLRAPAIDDPGGRGLLLVERVAERWGVEPEPGGKVVWFDLPRV